MIKNNKIIYLLLALFINACNEQPSYEELIKGIPKSLKSYNYKSTELNYSISVSNKFKRIDGDAGDSVSVEVLMDTTMDYVKGADLISILKYSCSLKKVSLHQAWKILLSKRLKFENFKIYSEGYTKFLSYPAYFEHSSCTISEMKSESINFFIRGDSSFFYGISLQVTSNRNYPDNLKKLLYSAKSFKLD